MNNYAKLRVNAGLLQTDVAKRLSCDRSTIAKWETGKSKPRAGILPKIAKLYKCSIDELYDKKEA